ncbi:MAG: thioredoxin family protein [Planctomycetota bacterium]
MFDLRQTMTPLITAACVLLATAAPAAVPEGWTDDYPAAQARAAAEGKDLLLDFTGSDWCVPCVALKQNVFDTPAFQSAVPQDFVLVQVDFPQNVVQPPALAAQNRELYSRYQIPSFPTIVLTDPEGRPYGMTHFVPESPDPYLDLLEAFQAQRAARDQAFADAEIAEGTSRAQALDRAMEAVGADLAVRHYADVVDEIIAADPDNTAGLKAKYVALQRSVMIEAALQEALALLGTGNLGAGLERIDQIIAEYQPEPLQLQLMIAIKGETQFQLGETERAIELFNEALGHAPESDLANQLRSILQQLESM